MGHIWIKKVFVTALCTECYLANFLLASKESRQLPVHILR